MERKRTQEKNELAQSEKQEVSYSSWKTLQNSLGVR